MSHNRKPPVQESISITRHLTRNPIYLYTLLESAYTLSEFRLCRQKSRLTFWTGLLQQFEGRGSGAEGKSFSIHLCL